MKIKISNLKYPFLLTIILVAITLIGCSNNSEKTAPTFKTGNYIQIDTAANKHIHIVRDENIQTEYNMNTGKITKNKITWPNDSTYILEIIETDNEIPEGKNYSKVEVQILSSTENTYFYKAHLSDFHGMMLGQLEKVEAFPCEK